MSATPPGANNEYSRGAGRSGGVSRTSERANPAARTGFGSGGRDVALGILAGGWLGATLLVVAEFTTLFHVNVATRFAPIKTVTSGSHHDYALIPVALLAAALAVSVFRVGSRPALLAIGVLGLVALLIALVGDLPDARANGLVGTFATQYVSATSNPGIGLYLETLGAAILIITCGAGFLLIGPPRRLRRGGGRPAPQGPGSGAGGQESDSMSARSSAS